MEKEPLKSVQFSTGTRVYYFDVYKDRKDTFYVSISEIPTDSNPSPKKRGKIFVHQNNLLKFIECLREISDAIQTGERHE